MITKKTRVNQQVAIKLGAIAPVGLLGFIMASLFIHQSGLIQQSGQLFPTQTAWKEESGTQQLLESFSLQTDDKVKRQNINQSFNSDATLSITLPTVQALGVSGTATLKSIDSYVRILLVRPDETELLVANLEYPDVGNVEFQSLCEETCVLDPTTPAFVKIELENASVRLDNLEYLQEQSKLRGEVQQLGVRAYNNELHKSQNNDRIAAINKQNIRTGQPWEAGDTGGILALSYKDKKEFFGKQPTPELNRLLFYKRGYFPVSPPVQSSDATQPQPEQTTDQSTVTVQETSKLSSAQPTPTVLGEESQRTADPEPFVFDWRDRHGNDWITPVIDQCGCWLGDHLEYGWWWEDCEDAGFDWRCCGSCSVMSSVATTETHIGLYYNEVLNKDLSEQKLMSCVDGSCDEGWDSGKVLNFSRLYGTTEEVNDPHTAQENECPGIEFDSAGAIAGREGIGYFMIHNTVNILEWNGATINYLHTFGESGTGDGQFQVGSSTNGIAVINDRILITDSMNHRVQIFDLDGNYVGKFGVQGNGDGQFEYPSGIAIVGERIYVADTGTNQIQVFNLALDHNSASFVFRFGSLGTSDGQFRSPKGVHSFNNKLYVADSINDRIQVFDLEGGFLEKYGIEGSGDGQFNNPSDVGFWKENILVLDTGNDRIQMFDADWNFLFKAGGHSGGDHGFDNPRHMAIWDNTVYVSDYSNERIQILSLNQDNTLSFIGDTSAFYSIPSPWKISDYSSINAYTPLGTKQAIMQKGPITISYYPWNHTMTLVGFGEVTSGGGYWPGNQYIPEDSPLIGKTYFIAKNSWGAEWGDKGHGNFIFPLESFNQDTDFKSVAGAPIPPPDEPIHKIQCTDNDLDGYCWWGIEAEKPEAGCPSSCADQPLPDCDDANSELRQCPTNYMCGNHPYSPSGENISFGDYPAGYGNETCCGDDENEFTSGTLCCNNVLDQTDIPTQVFDFSYTFGSMGSEPGQFNRPYGLALSNNRLFVSDTMNHRLQIFNIGKDGRATFLMQYGGSGSAEGQFASPQDIEVYKNLIYVSDTDNNRIQVFSFDRSNINYLHSYGTAGSGPDQFNKPAGLAVVGEYLVVSDSDNNRIKILLRNPNNTLSLIGNYGTYGSGQGQLKKPLGVGYANGLLYVSDSYNDRIQYFHFNGDGAVEFAGIYGEMGYSIDQFQNPWGIASFQNHLLFTDASKDTLGDFIRLSDGTISGERYIATTGVNEGQLNNPTDVVTDGSQIFVADSLNNRIQRFVSTDQTGICAIACVDGTPLNQCSQSKPNYCDNGILTNDCQTCGCPSGMACNATGDCKYLAKRKELEKYEQAPNI
ncbi:MAG: 6-bladed beta-propeller [bacterium]